MVSAHHHEVWLYKPLESIIVLWNFFQHKRQITGEKTNVKNFLSNDCFNWLELTKDYTYRVWLMNLGCKQVFRSKWIWVSLKEIKNIQNQSSSSQIPVLRTIGSVKGWFLQMISQELAMINIVKIASNKTKGTDHNIINNKEAIQIEGFVKD